MLSLAALAVLSPDERGFVEDIYLKYEKKLYAEALGITGNRHDPEGLDTYRARSPEHRGGSALRHLRIRDRS